MKLPNKISSAMATVALLMSGSAYAGAGFLIQNVNNASFDMSVNLTPQFCITDNGVPAHTSVPANNSSGKYYTEAELACEPNGEMTLSFQPTGNGIQCVVQGAGLLTLVESDDDPVSCGITSPVNAVCGQLHGFKVFTFSVSASSDNSNPMNCTLTFEQNNS